MVSTPFEVDLDARLIEVWLEIWERSEWAVADLGPLVRLAYGRGYVDALTEPERGRLCREHGYSVPARRRKA
jgi:hypothetical protein